MTDIQLRNKDKMNSLNDLFENENLWKDKSVMKILSAVMKNTEGDVNIIDKDGNTFLHHLMMEASTTSDCAMVLNKLLSEKININVRNHDERTCLHFLFLNENLWKDTNILNVLFSAGAHANVIDYIGKSPLHYLMKYADTPNDCLTILNILLAHKADVNIVGSAMLHLLFRNKNLWKDNKILKTLLSAGSFVNATVDCNLCTPLHTLMRQADISSNCLIAVNTLLTHKADVNLRDHFGNTALHLFFRNKNLWKNIGILNALLYAGAHANATEEFGITPLYHLMEVADSDLLPVLNTLLTHNVDVNARRMFGFPPIFVLLNKPDIWKYINAIFVLIAEGVDLNIVEAGETPISQILDHKRNSSYTKPWVDILKLIIRCEILKFQKYFCNIISEEVLVSQFMALDIFRKIYAQEEWSYSYVKDCISELLQMMKYTFEGNFSLSRHLFHFFENKRQLKSFPADILDNVLENIAQGCYPCYGEMVKLLIHPHDFADHLTICTKNNTEELFLNSYCVSAIAKFLPKNDLINLHQAAYRANEKRILEDP